MKLEGRSNVFQKQIQFCFGIGDDLGNIAWRWGDLREGVSASTKHRKYTSKPKKLQPGKPHVDMALGPALQLLTCLWFPKGWGRPCMSLVPTCLGDSVFQVWVACLELLFSFWSPSTLEHLSEQELLFSFLLPFPWEAFSADQV